MKQNPKIIREQKFKESFTHLLKFAGMHSEERWISVNPDPSNVCPICDDLQSLGWVEFGLLPPFQEAHSIIGEGNWKCPDSACMCTKDFRRRKGPAPEDITPLSGNTGDNPLSLYVGLSTDKETAIKKISEMKKKYSNGCGHSH